MLMFSVALDRENQAMRMRPPTMDLGSLSQPMLPRHGDTFPRRASVSVDRNVAETDRECPKKKKGFARIWGIVTKHRKPKNEAPRGREVVHLDRPEDDVPLAPPPPLSYLVNRSPRERTMSSASRRASVPNGTMPPTNALPTPTSIRSTWIEDGSRPIGAPLTAHTEESVSNMNALAEQPPPTSSGTDAPPPMGSPRFIQPMMSEPDMRQRSQQDPTVQSLADLHQQLAASRPSVSARPISMYSLHKSLPPLPPNEEPASGSMPTPVDMPRPQTMFDAMPQSITDSPEGLAQPNPPFRNDGRRQSFSGTGLRPDLTQPAMNMGVGVGTFPLNNIRQPTYVPQDTYDGYSPYAEMGALQLPASHSTGRLDVRDQFQTEKQVGKRRSRFGLANLLGKVSRSSTDKNISDRGRLSVVASNLAPTPGPPTSESDPSVTEYGANGNASSSRSRHGNGNGSGFGFGNANGQSRMSVASRKAIEELVDQDPKFVAYRYPSVDQNIALLR